MQYKNVSPSQFADEIGVQRSNISHILSGRNNPSLDLILKILSRYPEIHVDWLVLGKGAMLEGILPDNDTNESKDSSTINRTCTYKSPSLFDELEPPVFLGENAEEQPIKKDLSPSLASQQQHTDIKQELTAEKPIAEDMFTLDTQNTHSNRTPATSIVTKKLVKMLVLYDDYSIEEFTKSQKV